jgi:hypothetical protein
MWFKSFREFARSIAILSRKNNSGHCVKQLRGGNPLRLEPLEERLLLSSEISQRNPSGSGRFRPSDTAWTVVLDTVVNWIDVHLLNCGGGDAPHGGSGDHSITVRQLDNGAGSTAHDPALVVPHQAKPIDPTLLGALFQIRRSEPYGQMPMVTDRPGTTPFPEAWGTEVFPEVTQIPVPAGQSQLQNGSGLVTPIDYQ